MYFRVRIKNLKLIFKAYDQFELYCVSRDLGLFSLLINESIPLWGSLNPVLCSFFYLFHIEKEWFDIFFRGMKILHVAIL